MASQDCLMKLQASLHNTQDQPHPVYLNIRLWAQPSTDAVSPAKAHGSLLPALGAHARLRALAARAASHFLCARLWCMTAPSR